MQWLQWGPGFVMAFFALSYGAWIVTTWIRSRHGYPIENEWGGTVDKSGLGAERKIVLLTNENAEIKDRIGRLEERLRVLERIATDAPARLSDEIEKLR